MIVANYAPWRLDLWSPDGKLLKQLPVIAWSIDETDSDAIPKPITPLGTHHDPSAYRLASGYGTLSPTPGAAPIR